MSVLNSKSIRNMNNVCGSPIILPPISATNTRMLSNLAETRTDYGNDSNEKRQINVVMKFASLTKHEIIISASRWRWIMRLFTAG